MIICIDVGNTNIKYAIFDKDELKFSFRVATDFKKTSDEYGAQLTAMLTANGVGVQEIEGGIISSVRWIKCAIYIYTLSLCILRPG